MTGEMLLVILGLKIYVIGLWFSMLFLSGEESGNPMEKDSQVFIALIKILLWFIVIPYKFGKLFHKLNKFLEK
jgi:hypothetical protein